MIRIAFRFDDPSLTSDKDIELEIIKLCKEFRVKINFSVIPFKATDKGLIPLNRVSASHLIEAYNENLIEISQHGFSHENHQQDKAAPPSEFSGVMGMDQARMIEEGSQLLDDVFGKQQRGFVPPWNSFDDNTLKELELKKFLFLSSGFELPDKVLSNLPLLPRTCHLHNLQLAINNAKPFFKYSPIIIVVLHHYDFFCENAERMSVDKFRALLSGLVTNNDVCLTSLNELSGTMKPNELLNSIRRTRIFSSLHWRIKRYLPKNCLLISSTISILFAVFRSFIHQNITYKEL